VQKRNTARATACGAILAASLASTDVARALVWPDVPERVERGLGSTDPSARRVSARELSTLGVERATPLVLRALGDPDLEVKLAAAQSAIRLRVAPATEAVLPWLGDRETRLRIAACDVARALPDRVAIPPLARALGDGEATVRAAAAEALGAFTSNPDAVAPLLGKIDDASPVVRVVIARALARLEDPRAVVPLVGKVQDSVPEVRQAVARALGELGDPRATQALLLQLRDGAPDVRVEALGALGRLRAPEAVDAIAPLALDRNAALRQSALTALGRIASPGAVHALVATLGFADDAGGGLEHTPVRDALVLAGGMPDGAATQTTATTATDPAKPPRLQVVAGELAAVLERPPSAAAATSAAWILGELHARAHAPLVVSAMRRGTLPAPAALRALGGMGAAEAVPVVLEYTADGSPVVREEALRAAGALLDPAHPDGRAVEPLAAALRDARLSALERASLARLLGRTGAGRAGPVLAGLATAKDAGLRIAAIDALGTLGPATAERARDLDPLLDALADADPAVRLHAAVALADAGEARVRDALVARLDGADEVDRAALLTALGGVLSRVPTDAAVNRLARELDLAAGAERDALLQAIGRAPLASARAILLEASRSDDVDDRRKVATLAGAQPDGASLATALLSDRDASVRAQAAWSLGNVGAPVAVSALAQLLRGDPDGAIDATAAIGRIAARARAPEASVAALCPLLTDTRPYVRANALAGLALAGARCGDGRAARAALESDASDAVRAAAALTVARALRESADRRALDRCASSDNAGFVARRCRTPPPSPTRSHALEVYIVADLTSTPRPRAAYALELADGLIRVGLSDRRGAAFDPVAPEGDVTLRRPASAR
jgi:HEAT repeat protein